MTTEVIKGFDAELKCLGFAFVLGENYRHEGPVKQCKSGFHAITAPVSADLDTLLATSRFLADGHSLRGADGTADTIIQLCNAITALRVRPATVHVKRQEASAAADGARFQAFDEVRQLVRALIEKEDGNG